MGLAIGHKEIIVSAPSERPRTITSAFAPDLEAVKKFIADMIAKGAVVALVTSIVALLVKMRDLNAELMGKLASKSRKRPPSETMRRLQMELPFLCAAAVNDTQSAPTWSARSSANGQRPIMRRYVDSRSPLRAPRRLRFPTRTTRRPRNASIVAELKPPVAEPQAVPAPPVRAGEEVLRAAGGGVVLRRRPRSVSAPPKLAGE